MQVSGKLLQVSMLVTCKYVNILNYMTVLLRLLLHVVVLLEIVHAAQPKLSTLRSIHSIHYIHCEIQLKPECNTLIV